MEVSEVHSAKQGLNLWRNQKNPTGDAAVVQTKYPRVGRETTISTLAGEDLLCPPPPLRFLLSAAFPYPPTLCAVYFRTADFHVCMTL